MQKNLDQFQEKYVLIGLGSCIVFIACALLNYHFSGYVFDMSSMNLGIESLYIASGIFGTFSIFTMAILLSRLDFLKNIGRNSMYYYGLHYEILGGVEKVIGGGYLQTIVTISFLSIIIFFYKKSTSCLRDR